MASFCLSLRDETFGNLSNERVPINYRSIAKHSNDNSSEPQDAPASNHDRPLSRSWHFCRLSTNGNFPFLEKREIQYFQRCLQPLYFFRPPPPTPLLLPFCAGVQFSSRSHHALIDRKKKKHEKIEGCEQSTYKQNTKLNQRRWKDTLKRLSA